MAFTSRDADFTILVADEQLETMRLNRLYGTWCKAAAAGALPGAAFLDPQRHDYIAAMLVVVDVVREDERQRYRYRSVGSHFIEHLGIDPAGTYMDQHPESYFAERAIRACDLVVQTRRPIHARARRDIDGRSFLIEFLLLPVAGPDGAVGSLLIAQLYTPATD